MGEAITDTGPPLHLYEIEHLPALRAFERLLLPASVRAELTRFQVWESMDQLGLPVLETVVVSAAAAQLEIEGSAGTIQSADAEVLSLARLRGFRLPVLTNDLALRTLVQKGGGRAVGSFGVLLRAYRDGLLDKQEVRSAVEELMATSSLYLGREFRRFMRDRLNQILAV